MSTFPPEQKDSSSDINHLSTVDQSTALTSSTSSVSTFPEIGGAGRPKDSEVAHQVLRAIRQIVHRISEHSKQLSTEFGLTVPQLMCLKAVGELQQEGLQEITVANVSKRVQLSPATVSRIIERMVRVGWLERERAEKDRRKVSLSLTAAGRDRFETLPTPLQERFVARLGALPAQDRLRLLSSLQQLSALMDAEDIDAAPMLHHGDAWSEGPDSL